MHMYVHDYCRDIGRSALCDRFYELGPEGGMANPAAGNSPPDLGAYLKIRLSQLRIITTTPTTGVAGLSISTRD